jgi:hypothetical protein
MCLGSLLRESVDALIRASKGAKFLEGDVVDPVFDLWLRVFSYRRALLVCIVGERGCFDEGRLDLVKAKLLRPECLVPFREVDCR